MLKLVFANVDPPIPLAARNLLIDNALKLPRSDHDALVKHAIALHSHFPHIQGLGVLWNQHFGETPASADIVESFDKWLIQAAQLAHQ